VIWLCDAMVSDGDTSITTAAAINHNHHIVTILRDRYSEPKLSITDEVAVAPDASNPNLLPYSCEIHDFCRLLSVRTYNGQILFFRLPELPLEIEKRTKTGPLPMEEEQVKKLLRYPLEMATLEGEPKKVTERVMELSFKGAKVNEQYSNVKEKLLGMRKAKPAVVEEPKKDTKKK
jgi:hypothetical protein